MEGSQVWLRKMAEHLPAIEDDFFMRLSAAVHGVYEPRGIAADPEAAFLARSTKLQRDTKERLRRTR